MIFWQQVRCVLLFNNIEAGTDIAFLSEFIICPKLAMSAYQSNYLSNQDVQCIYLALSTDLHLFLTRRVKCPETASDLLQDLYFRLPRLRPPPASEGEVRAWLFTVASNLSIDYLRSQQRHGELLEVYFSDHTYSDTSNIPDRNAQAAQQLQQLQSALSDLPDQCAEILYLNRIEGLTHSQIAEQLGISTSWVEKQIARAITHCRRVINND